MEKYELARSQECFVFCMINRPISVDLPYSNSVGLQFCTGNHTYQHKYNYCIAKHVKMIVSIKDTIIQ